MRCVNTKPVGTDPKTGKRRYCLLSTCFHNPICLYSMLNIFFRRCFTLHKRKLRDIDAS